MNFQVLYNFYAEWLDAKTDLSFFGEKPKQIWIQLRILYVYYTYHEKLREFYFVTPLIVEIYL